MASDIRDIHDTSFALGMHLVSVFGPLLREEEKKAAFDECYEAAKAALEAFVILQERKHQRLYPMSKN
jgi:hypothetical protein